VRLRASRGRQGLSRSTAEGLKKSLEPSAVLRNASSPVRSPCRWLLEARSEGLRASRTTADGSEKSLEPSAVPLYATDAPRDAARTTADGLEKSLRASAVDRIDASARARRLDPLESTRPSGRDVSTPLEAARPRVLDDL
jgi:hypothetical protein